MPSTIRSIAPSLPALATNIARGLLNDLAAGRLNQCGGAEIRAAMDARPQARRLPSIEAIQLEALITQRLLDQLEGASA